ncbi:hypothetical protein D4R86_03095 [bacterium]|nr:MAG: hypothetical protein D4R86_03095 [bacterium]
MIKNSLHSLMLNTISKIFLANRTILHGEYQGEKTICISFDCDYESDMLQLEQLLPVLKKNEVHTSFAIPGWLVKKFPERIKRLIDSGHEIVNHTFTHPDNFRKLSTPDKAKEIEDFQKLMKKLFDYLPQGFRCPHLFHQYPEELTQVLKKNKLKYDSSLLGNCVFMLGDIIEVPLNPCPRHLYKPFDSYHHFYPNILSESLDNFLKDFKQMINENNFVNMYLDPRDLITKIPLKAFEEMICLSKDEGFRFSPLNDFCLNTENVPRL